METNKIKTKSLAKEPKVDVRLILFVLIAPILSVLMSLLMAPLPFLSHLLSEKTEDSSLSLAINSFTYFFTDSVVSTLLLCVFIFLMLIAGMLLLRRKQAIFVFFGIYYAVNTTLLVHALNTLSNLSVGFIPSDTAFLFSLITSLGFYILSFFLSFVFLTGVLKKEQAANISVRTKKRRVPVAPTVVICILPLAYEGAYLLRDKLIYPLLSDIPAIVSIDILHYLIRNIPVFLVFGALLLFLVIYKDKLTALTAIGCFYIADTLLNNIGSLLISPITDYDFRSFLRYLSQSFNYLPFIRFFRSISDILNNINTIAGPIIVTVMSILSALATCLIGTTVFVIIIIIFNKAKEKKQTSDITEAA